MYYLTGSRFFGYNNPDSDWDYMCQTSRKAFEELKESNFQFLGKSPSGCFIFGKDNVHIILVPDINKWLEIRNSLVGKITRENSFRLWDEALDGRMGLF